MKKFLTTLFVGWSMIFSLNSQTILFEKVYDWSEWDMLGDFIPTSDNGYAMTVTSNAQSIVIKLDSNGDSLWSYVIDPNGDAWDSQIIESANSDLIIANQLDGNAFILRLNSSGDSIDGFLYPYAYDDNRFISVIEAVNGDYIVSDRMEQNNGNAPPIVALRSFSSTGILNWSQVLGGSSAYPWDVILTSSNEILATGLYDFWNMKIWIAKFDLFGNILYSNIYEESQVNQIIETSSGEFLASVDGYSMEDGNYNAMKLNPDGTVVWKSYSNNGQDGNSYTICKLKPDRYAIGGEKQGSLAVKTFNGDGDSLGFFTYDSYYFQFASRMFSNEEYLIVGGGIKEQDNSRSILILKLLIDSLYTSIEPIVDHSFLSKVIIFPNPVKDLVKFELHGDQRGPLLIEIFDINGMLSHSEYFTALRPLRMNLSFLESGYYFVKVKSKCYTSYGKFIISR